MKTAFARYFDICFSGIVTADRITDFADAGASRTASGTLSEDDQDEAIVELMVSSDLGLSVCG